MKNVNSWRIFKMVAVSIIGVILVVLAAVLTVMILLQTGKEKGLSGTISGGSSDTYFGRSGGSKKEKWLFRFTLIGSIVFVVLTVVLTILLTVGTGA